MTPAAATCLAKNLYLGPAISGVDLTADVARKLPWAETGSVADLKLFDWATVNAQRPALTDRWNREIRGSWPGRSSSFP